MRTDAMQSFFGGKEMQPRQMDRTNGGCRKTGSMGFAMEASDSNSARSFQERVNKVITENSAAEKSTTTALNSENRCGQQQDAEQTNETDSLMSLAGLINRTGSDESEETAVVDTVADSQLRLIEDDVAISAERIVREALADISETLGLNVFQGLEQLSLKEIGSDTQAQFAEIVFVLKKMIQGFEFSRANGMTIETPGVTVNGNNIDAITDILRTGTFKIEVACNVLGIAEEVQKEVSIKLEMYSSTTGIIQASDPSTLTMATQHTDQLFGSLFDDRSQHMDIAVLVQKIRALLAQEGEKSPQTVVVNGATIASPNGQLDSQQFDARMYRALLKIDAQEDVSQQNGKAAAGNEKMDLPKTEGGVLSLAQNLSESTSEDGNENLSVLDVQLGAQRQQGAGMESRVNNTLFKMTDQTVMEQITTKMQSVIRSGLTEVRIMLRPESLGEVSMRIRMEGDLVLARIEVQNQQVKEIMERNLPMLKDALAQQNLTAGSFDIQVGNGLGRHSDGAPQSPWQGEDMVHGEQYREGKEEKDEQGSSGQEQSSGNETGRRFGSNSVEYFA